VRLVHATDIHWVSRPSLADLAPKRALGAANLFLAGRHARFDPAAQRALGPALRALEPDLVLLTGDLTALALDSEFEAARQDLAPVLDGIPAMVIPGNHDAYTVGAVRADTMRRVFGAWMHPTDGIARLDVGPITVLGLDPCRPTLLSATGVVPDAQLAALASALRDPGLADRTVILAIHYPLVDRHGALYDNRRHGLLNAGALVAVLRDAPRRPDLVAHGHIHRGFRGRLSLGDAEIPTFDPGTGGYACDPVKRHTAAFNVYEVRDGRLADVQRWLWDGAAFAPEIGGAYGTGW
jgi:3',5'-cyclic AMP phosphodiesterase CpdA